MERPRALRRDGGAAAAACCGAADGAGVSPWKTPIVVTSPRIVVTSARNAIPSETAVVSGLGLPSIGSNLEARTVLTSSRSCRPGRLVRPPTFRTAYIHLVVQGPNLSCAPAGMRPASRCAPAGMRPESRCAPAGMRPESRFASAGITRGSRRAPPGIRPGDAFCATTGARSSLPRRGADRDTHETGRVPCRSCARRRKCCSVPTTGWLMAMGSRPVHDYPICHGPEHRSASDTPASPRPTAGVAGRLSESDMRRL